MKENKKFGLRDISKLSEEIRYMLILNNGNPKWIIFGFPFLGIDFDKVLSLKETCIFDDLYPEYDNTLQVTISIPLQSAIRCCIKLDGTINTDKPKCECEFYDIVSELTSHPNYITSFKSGRHPLDCIYMFKISDDWKDDFNKIKKGSLSQISDTHTLRMKNAFKNAPNAFLLTMEELLNVKLK